MTVDRASFLVRFPEFEPVGVAMLDVTIQEAIRNVDASIFGTKTDDAVGWKTAHLLAIKPFGRNARMVSKDGSTTYDKQFTRLARSMTPGFRVI